MNKGVAIGAFSVLKNAENRFILALHFDRSSYIIIKHSEMVP